MPANKTWKDIEDQFRVGCDPELFLFNKKTKKLVSGHPFIKGTKTEPHPVDKGAIQLDGISAEFNIDPASNAKEFLENIITVLSELRKMVPDELAIVPIPAVNTGSGASSQEFFESLPEKVKELGCSPSFDIYNLQTTFPPDRPDVNPYMFTGSGHIHVGFTQLPDDVNPMEDRAHLLDCYYATCKLAVHLYRGEAIDRLSYIRNQLYGKRWETRIKKYGVEIRYPNNTWLWYSPNCLSAPIAADRSGFGQSRVLLDRWVNVKVDKEIAKVRELLANPEHYV